MQFSEEPFQQRYVFRRVDEHGVMINDTLYTHSVMVGADEILSDWPVAKMDDINEATLSLLLASNPDMVIIGTGQKALRLPESLLALCWERRIGVEVMSTPAAAKTYNLLVNEGRKVSVGVILGV